MVKKSKNKIVVIGGGTGTFTVLLGLKKYPNLDTSAIVTMADDGGSNKVLRDEFGLLPTSGIRQCIVALAEDSGLLRKLFSYRFSQGTGISGMTFGNLFMAAVTDIVGSQRKAIEETCRLLDVRGNILPLSYEATSLLAKYEDGTEVLGEHYIDIGNSKVSKQRIKMFRTIPAITLDKEAAGSIRDADMVVIGPGDLYTNTVANLVAKGMKNSLMKSKAKIVFVMNLMTKPGESYNYKASDFLSDVSRYLPAERLDYVLVNTDMKLDTISSAKYAEEGSIPVEDDLEDLWHHARIVRVPLRSHRLAAREKGDRLNRSLVRHDSQLLARALSRLL